MTELVHQLEQQVPGEDTEYDDVGPARREAERAAAEAAREEIVSRLETSLAQALLADDSWLSIGDDQGRWSYACKLIGRLEPQLKLDQLARGRLRPIARQAYASWQKTGRPAREQTPSITAVRSGSATTSGPGVDRRQEDADPGGPTTSRASRPARCQYGPG